LEGLRYDWENLIAYLKVKKTYLLPPITSLQYYQISCSEYRCNQRKWQTINVWSNSLRGSYSKQNNIGTNVNSKKYTRDYLAISNKNHGYENVLHETFTIYVCNHSH
jgi:hypothetical protein